MAMATATAMAVEVSYSLSSPFAGLPTYFPASPPFRWQQRPTPVALRASASSASPTPSSVGKSSTELVDGHDLLIVGPGVLGRIVAQKWRQDYPDCQIFGETFSTDHHDELLKLGINPYVKGSEEIQQIPFIIYCAPPSRSPDYPGDVRQSTSRWDVSGSFLFTSSSAAYDCHDNGFCDEDSPIVPLGRSPRTDLLLKAENVVLEAGGSVLRLAGLYKADRGAHNYWLGKGKVDLRPDHILNLIHYEDAASLSVAILKKKLRGHVLLGCDNNPVSRQEVMECVNKSGKFSQRFKGFTGTSDPLGKRLNNSKTRSKIGWEPRYSSFAKFLEML